MRYTVMYISVECGRLFLRGQTGQNRSIKQRSGMILEVQTRSFSAGAGGARQCRRSKVFIFKKFQGT